MNIGDILIPVYLHADLDKKDLNFDKMTELKLIHTVKQQYGEDRRIYKKSIGL
jgi:hypothetical protein